MAAFAKQVKQLSIVCNVEFLLPDVLNPRGFVCGALLTE
jgi:hypothetical protein